MPRCAPCLVEGQWTTTHPAAGQTHTIESMFFSCASIRALLPLVRFAPPPPPPPCRLTPAPRLVAAAPPDVRGMGGGAHVAHVYGLCTSCALRLAHAAWKSPPHLKHVACTPKSVCRHSIHVEPAAELPAGGGGGRAGGAAAGGASMEVADDGCSHTVGGSLGSTATVALATASSTAGGPAPSSSAPPVPSLAGVGGS